MAQITRPLDLSPSPLVRWPLASDQMVKLPPLAFRIRRLRRRSRCSPRAPACSVNVPLCPNASSGDVGPVAVSTTLPRPGGAGHRRDRGRWRPGARRAARPTATTR